MKKLTIALLGAGLYTWDGGVDHLSNIACILQYAKKSKQLTIDLFLFLPREYYPVRLLRKIVKKLDDHEKENIQRITNVFKVVCPSVPIVYYRKHIKKIYDDGGRNLDKALHKINADICLPVLRDYYPQMKTPWMGYIADFQEKHLPILFDKSTLKYRENNSIKQVQHTQFFLLTSMAVKGDLEKYYPGKYVAFAEPFAPFSQQAFIDCNEDISNYNLPPKYFLISNQFWIHKNHMTAIKAMRVLIDKGYKDIGLVCTGRMNTDERDKSYCAKLIELVKDLQLENNVYFVGFVPKLHQIQMLKDAVALIQPSLFEGDPGGGAVFNAYSLMVPSIVADIEVNNEAEESDLIRHFKALDENDLAEKMVSILREPERKQSYEAIKTHNEKNMEILADFYLSAIEKCIKNFKRDEA